MTKVRILHRHVDPSEDDHYHEWITLGERVRADINGRRNPRMYEVNWTLWLCNNSDCKARAYVADWAIGLMIERTPVS